MHPQDRKCIPQPEQESIFRTVFAGWLRFGGLFIWSLSATTKKKVVNVFGKKSAPPDKILATPMQLHNLNLSVTLNLQVTFKLA